MLKLSGKTIESLYLKNKTINKAYVNGKLIFNKTKLTKPYYCEVEYLESTGTQFINTDVYSKDINYIEVEAQYTKINARQVLLGCYTSQAWNTFGATNVTSVYENFFIQWINAGDYGGSAVCDTNKHLFVFDKKSKKFSVDGSIYMLEEIYDVNDTLYMFASHSGSTIDRQAFARIYRVKLKNNDNLVRDYIPVLDFDMQPCLYDKVSGKLFYNQGTGSFLCGRQIHEVEYIESTGTQWIDTNYIPNNNTSVEAIISGISANSFALSASGTWFIGARQSYLNNAFGFYYNPSNQNIYYSFGNSMPYANYPSSLLYNNKNKFYLDNNGLYINDNKITTTTNSSFTSPVNLSLFGLNNNGTTISFTSFKMHSCKIFEKGILIRDYIPAVDENGKSFMFDRISHTIFDNSGTGEFLYPPVELKYIESTGTQWIDSGISPTNKTKWEITFAFTKETTGQLMGAGHAGNYRFNLGIESDKFRFAIGSGWTTLVETKDTDIHTWVLNSENNSGSLDDTTVISTYSSNFSTTNFNIIFCNRAVGSNYCSIKIYGSKIYDNDTLVREFMPCLLSGEAGLWDKVNNVFYPNSGTEKFLYKIK